MKIILSIITVLMIAGAAGAGDIQCIPTTQTSIPPTSGYDCNGHFISEAEYQAIRNQIVNAIEIVQLPHELQDPTEIVYPSTELRWLTEEEYQSLLKEIEVLKQDSDAANAALENLLNRMDKIERWASEK